MLHIDWSDRRVYCEMENKEQKKRKDQEKRKK
jgi:hypothetical protein